MPDSRPSPYYTWQGELIASVPYLMHRFPVDEIVLFFFKVDQAPVSFRGISAGPMWALADRHAILRITEEFPSEGTMVLPVYVGGNNPSGPDLDALTAALRQSGFLIGDMMWVHAIKEGAEFYFNGRRVGRLPDPKSTRVALVMVLKGVQLPDEGV